jgi:hypothetical protein
MWNIEILATAKAIGSGSFAPPELDLTFHRAKVV